MPVLAAEVAKLPAMLELVEEVAEAVADSVIETVDSAIPTSSNCTVGAWFLHSPSLVLTKDGRPRVGYQARDISGGWKNPTPSTTPDCKAGTDMTWSRMAIMPAVH